MLSSRLLIAVVILAAGVGSAAAAGCPAYSGKHALVAAQLFDGPPAKMVDLETEDGTWDLTPYKNHKGGYFLVCHFSGTVETKEVEISDPVSFCASTEHAGAVRVTCR